MGDWFLEEGYYSVIPKCFPSAPKIRPLRNRKYSVPLIALFWGVTPLSSWGGSGRTGEILDGESQRPWGAPSTVTQMTPVGRVSLGHRRMDCAASGDLGRGGLCHQGAEKGEPECGRLRSWRKWSGSGLNRREAAGVK